MNRTCIKKGFGYVNEAGGVEFVRDKSDLSTDMLGYLADPTSSVIYACGSFPRGKRTHFGRHLMTRKKYEVTVVPDENGAFMYDDEAGCVTSSYSNDIAKISVLHRGSVRFPPRFNLEFKELSHE